MSEEKEHTIRLTIDIAGWAEVPDLSPILDALIDSIPDIVNHIEATGIRLGSFMQEQMEASASVEDVMVVTT